MKHVAAASNPGKCAMASCTRDGNKIYEGSGIRMLACTNGHADAVEKVWNQAPPGMPMKDYKARRAEVLTQFNARPAPVVDDYDIEV